MKIRSAKMGPLVYFRNMPTCLCVLFHVSIVKKNRKDRRKKVNGEVGLVWSYQKRIAGSVIKGNRKYQKKCPI